MPLKEKEFSRICALLAMPYLQVYCFLLECPILIPFIQAHSTGPALGGLPGQNIASGDGFNYSSALAAKATLKWTDGNLDKWLKSPADFAPGNGMAFAGIASGKDRQDIIAYLKGG
eukprot:403334527